MSAKTAAALLSFLMASAAFAQTDPNVVQGQAQITQTPSATTIDQLSRQAVINWQSFDVPAGTLMRIHQPAADAVLLNRVIGSTPSSLQGNLQANGQVWILNPNGILIGPNARLDVGSLVASTLSISDDDFMTRNFHLVQDPRHELSYVVNEGRIATSLGGHALLLAPFVANTGSIDAPQGVVHLTSGTDITLHYDGGRFVWLLRAPHDGEPRDVRLSRESVDLARAVVNTSGVFVADRVVERNGVVYLTGGEGVTLNSGTLASPGGAVNLLSEQATLTTESSRIEAEKTTQQSRGPVLMQGLAKGKHLTLDGVVVLSLGAVEGDGGLFEIRSGASLIIDSSPAAPPGSAASFVSMAHVKGMKLDATSEGSIDVFGDLTLHHGLALNARGGGIAVHGLIVPCVRVDLAAAGDVTLDGEILFDNGRSLDPFLSIEAGGDLRINGRLSAELSGPIQSGNMVLKGKNILINGAIDLHLHDAGVSGPIHVDLHAGGNLILGGTLSGKYENASIDLNASLSLARVSIDGQNVSIGGNLTLDMSDLAVRGSVDVFVDLDLRAEGDLSLQGTLKGRYENGSIDVDSKLSLRTDFSAGGNILFGGRMEWELTGGGASIQQHLSAGRDVIFTGQDVLVIHDQKAGPSGGNEKWIRGKDNVFYGGGIVILLDGIVSSEPSRTFTDLKLEAGGDLVVGPDARISLNFTKIELIHPPDPGKPIGSFDALANVDLTAGHNLAMDGSLSMDFKDLLISGYSFNSLARLRLDSGGDASLRGEEVTKISSITLRFPKGEVVPELLDVSLRAAGRATIDGRIDLCTTDVQAEGSFDAVTRLSIEAGRDLTVSSAAEITVCIGGNNLLGGSDWPFGGSMAGVSLAAGRNLTMGGALSMEMDHLQVGSFFDVFTELSLEAGRDLIVEPTAQIGLNFTKIELVHPPDPGAPASFDVFSNVELTAGRDLFMAGPVIRTLKDIVLRGYSFNSLARLELNAGRDATRLSEDITKISSITMRIPKAQPLPELLDVSINASRDAAIGGSSLFEATGLDVDGFFDGFSELSVGAGRDLRMAGMSVEGFLDVKLSAGRDLSGRGNDRIRNAGPVDDWPLETSLELTAGRDLNLSGRLTVEFLWRGLSDPPEPEVVLRAVRNLSLDTLFCDGSVRLSAGGAILDLNGSRLNVSASGELHLDARRIDGLEVSLARGSSLFINGASFDYPVSAVFSVTLDARGNVTIR